MDFWSGCRSPVLRMSSIRGDYDAEEISSYFRIVDGDQSVMHIVSRKRVGDTLADVCTVSKQKVTKHHAFDLVSSRIKDLGSLKRDCRRRDGG